MSFQPSAPPAPSAAPSIISEKSNACACAGSQINVAMEGSSDQFDYPMVGGEKYVDEYRQAVGLSALKSIPKWGVHMKEDRTDAMSWLIAAVKEMKDLKIGPHIIHKVLISKLMTAERNEMSEQETDQKIYDLRSFSKVFLKRFGDKLTAVQSLRKLMTKRMESAAVAEKGYQQYGHELSRLAHAAYRQLGLARELYKTIDQVIVVNAFIYGVGDKLSEYLLQQDPVDLEDCVEISLKWANAQGGLQRFAKNQILHVGAGHGGQQRRQGQGRKWRAHLCKRCRATKPQPTSCYHCFVCCETGHVTSNCPKATKSQ